MLFGPSTGCARVDGVVVNFFYPLAVALYIVSALWLGNFGTW